MNVVTHLREKPVSNVEMINSAQLRQALGVDTKTFTALVKKWGLEPVGTLPYGRGTMFFYSRAYVNGFLDKYREEQVAKARKLSEKALKNGAAAMVPVTPSVNVDTVVGSATGSRRRTARWPRSSTSTTTSSPSCASNWE